MRRADRGLRWGAGVLVMAAGLLAALGSAAAGGPVGARLPLAVAFVVLGATLAMPDHDPRYQRAGLLTAAGAALVFVSWTYPADAPA